MQCLQPARPFPHTSLGEARRSQSDPLRLPLSLSTSGAHYPSSCRSPYLSPPMSGSPPPKHISDPISGAKRRRQSSSSPAVTPTTHQLPEPLPTYSNHNSIRTTSAKIGVSIPQPPPNQSAPPLDGFPPVNEGPSPHLLPAFGAPASIAPRATALPPRSTRRAKAHVASACVNCKRKHLGCDSARPCRRCVVAGKEDSCVDVTHKRRGRPPLKAEEGPIRTYESTYGHSGILRVSQHPSASLSAQRGHKRTSSSREIRPSTEFHLSRPMDVGHGGRRSGMSPTVSMQPPLWAPHILPSPSATGPPPPLVPISLSGRSPTSNDQRRAQRPPMLSSGSRNPAFPRPLSDVSPVRPFSGEGLPHPISPHMKYKPHSPTDSSYFSSPGPSNSRSFAPLQGVSASSKLPEPAPSSIRLPPILPRTTLASDSGHPRVNTRPKSFSALSWMDTEKPSQFTGLDRNAPHSAPIYTGPPFRRDSEISHLSERSSSGHEPPHAHPMPLPPIRNTEPQQHQHHRNSPPQPHQEHARKSSTATIPDTINRTATSPVEDAKEAGPRPAKRLKMELGEMVNN